MEIDIVELKRVVDRLLDHLIHTRGVRVVELKNNYYWTVPDDQVYDMARNTFELGIGSLVDDWDFVSSLLDKETDPVTYQLTEVAPLLRYIGEVLGPELAGLGG